MPIDPHHSAVSSTLPVHAEASLVLSDGTVFPGRVGVELSACAGEAVFTTATSGYPESMTDPSYRGQILAFTYPEIGIYGVPEDQLESSKIYANALVVHRICRTPSLGAGRISFQEAVSKAGRGVLERVDTRALARHLRTRGSLQAAIVPGRPSAEEALEWTRRFNPAPPWPCAAAEEGAEPSLQGPRVAVIDFGLKAGILDCLSDLGASVFAVDPDSTSAEELLADPPHGVLLSNGPGDPAELDDQVAYIRDLIGKVPLMGICLGHQLLGRALGGETEKLPFGHRGVNHPVRDLVRNRTLITSQNHGYALTRDSLEKVEGVEVTHVHAGDGSVEGFACPRLRLRAVQFHPEARPGPVDARYLFSQFLDELGSSTESVDGAPE